MSTRKRAEKKQIPASELQPQPGRAKRQFIHTSRAWYAASALPALSDGRVTDEVMLLVPVSRDETCEIGVRWYALDHHEPPAAQIECFEESWRALPRLARLLAALAEASARGEHVGPDDLCRLLRRQGYEDVTQTKRPRGHGEES